MKEFYQAQQNNNKTIHKVCFLYFYYFFFPWTFNQTWEITSEKNVRK